MIKFNGASYNRVLIITFCIDRNYFITEKDKVCNDQEITRSERNSHSKTRGGNKTKFKIMYTKNNYRKPGEQLFPNRRPLGYPNIT